jgi:hypothetical protein
LLVGSKLKSRRCSMKGDQRNHISGAQVNPQYRQLDSRVRAVAPTRPGGTLRPALSRHTKSNRRSVKKRELSDRPFCSTEFRFRSVSGRSQFSQISTPVRRTREEWRGRFNHPSYQPS